MIRRTALAWLLLAVLLCAGTASAAPRDLFKAPDRIELIVDGVAGPIADNVRSYLTLTRYVQRQDLTDSQVRRLADRAVDEAADALRPFGYYSPQVRSRTSRDDDRWIVRLRIKPGDPVVMQEVDVQLLGEGARNPQLLEVLSSTPLKQGARLDHTQYENLKVDLLRTAQEEGFLDAKLTRRALEVDLASNAGIARITLETGGRYEFGEITFRQDALDQRLLNGYLRFAKGQPYSSEKLRNTQYALEDSNYFSSVSVSPGERDPINLTVPVTLIGEPIRRNRYGVSAGYGTDTGVRGKFTWDNRLVNRHGHRWRVEATASQIVQELIGRYVIPVGDPTLEKLEFSAGYINEEIGDLDSERYEGTVGLTQVMGHWQRVLFVRLNDERTTFPDGSSADDLLLIPGVSYASLPPNFLTGWVRDAAYYLELTGSPSTLGSDSSYLRFFGRAERVWQIRDPWYLRLRGEFGTSWVDEFSELPASQRFFAGGDRSVRGFAYNELGPKGTSPDGATGQDVGGEHKIVASVELERDFPRNLRGAVFFDAGNAFNDWGTDLEYSVGIGVRWRLPMLMIGLDVAQALSEPGKNPRVHLNITQVL